MTVNGKSFDLPVLILPGLNNATIAVALGYGRESANPDKTRDRIGRAAAGAGKNASSGWFDGSSVIYTAAATVRKTDATYALAQTQVHGSSEGRPVIYETNAASYEKIQKP